MTAPRLDEALLDAVQGGEAVAVPGLGGVVRGLVSVFVQPGPVVRESGRLAAALTRIARGTDDLRPHPKDKRFSDPAWGESPVYRRLGQGYVALERSLQALVDQMEASGADWHDVERARFAVRVLTSTAAPTNTPLGNPAVLKRAFETGGGSVVRGLRNALSDLRHNGGMPSQTDRSAFAVGKDLAVTPGAVVYRDEVVELLQYAPSTATVRQRPVLVVPPPIGRYYFLDLRPGRSFVEHAVAQGLQVFLLSWRNPGPDQAQWDLDTYAGAVLRGLEAVREITRSPDVNTLGFCAGGLLQTVVLNHLAVQDDPVVHSAAYGVTLLDYSERAPLGAFSSARLLELAGRSSARNGVITARSLGSVFSWMRPEDLIFNYVVNQWLLGNDPPVFDILAWNADGTNLPAALHQQFLDIFRDNTLCSPSAVTVLGSPVELGSIQVPTFVTGAVTDHLTPWTGCYRTTARLAGPSTFVLSNAGHIASLVNPPGNPRATYFADGPTDGDAQEWLAGATERKGSWWEAWAAWTLERSGEETPARPQLGSARHPQLRPAPGDYVLASPPT